MHNTKSKVGFQACIVAFCELELTRDELWVPICHRLTWITDENAWTLGAHVIMARVRDPISKLCRRLNAEPWKLAYTSTRRLGTCRVFRRLPTENGHREMCDKPRTKNLDRTKYHGQESQETSNAIAFLLEGGASGTSERPNSHASP